MLDIRLIRDQPEAIKQRLANRGGEAAALIDQILALDTARRSLETQKQKLQNELKITSREIGQGKKAGNDTSAAEAAMRELGTQIAAMDTQAAATEENQRALLLATPNVPHENCPVGHDAEANPVVRTWGEKPVLSAPVRNHIEIGEALGLFDFDAAAKIAGSGFVVFRGQGARLQRALLSFLLDLHTEHHGYTEVNTPYLVKRDCMVGTGQLPKFEDDMYAFDGGVSFLAPTAEVPVTNLEREKLLPHGELPIKYTGYSPCFRREAGSAGKMNRGMIRVHQFDKVELVQIVRPEDSMAVLETLTSHAEAVLQKLGLHYRVIELCTGDIGFGSAKTYDIEVWAPGQDAYLEVSSCSNFGDYQARRMNLRFKDEAGKNHFCHTLNGSGTALPRLYVALLETYQQPDGTVLLPEVLHRYMSTTQLG